MLPQNDWVKYSNLGFQIMASLGVFGYLGYWLDNRFPELQPLFLIVSLLFGAVVALYHLWVSVFK